VSAAGTTIFAREPRFRFAPNADAAWGRLKIVCPALSPYFSTQRPSEIAAEIHAAVEELRADNQSIDLEAAEALEALVRLGDARAFEETAARRHGDESFTEFVHLAIDALAGIRMASSP
jgi:hypothetical protein